MSKPFCRRCGFCCVATCPLPGLRASQCRDSRRSNQSATTRLSLPRSWSPMPTPCRMRPRGLNRDHCRARAERAPHHGRRHSSLRRHAGAPRGADHRDRGRADGSCRCSPGARALSARRTCGCGPSSRSNRDGRGPSAAAHAATMAAARKSAPRPMGVGPSGADRGPRHRGRSQRRRGSPARRIGGSNRGACSKHAAERSAVPKATASGS